MKGRLIALLGICIAILIVSGPDTQGKKPVKPDETQSELIVFTGVTAEDTGDLEGYQVVEDCCYNVDTGVYSTYTMTLNFDVGENEPGSLYIPAGTPIVGHLFINYAHPGRKKYVVHFWNDDFGIEIIGGVIDYDRKTEVTTVTFEDEVCSMCEALELDDAGVPTGECLDDWISFDVSFILVREPWEEE